MTQEIRRCTRCQVEKPIGEFRTRRRKDGTTAPTAWCRSCLNAASRECMRERAKDEDHLIMRRERDRLRQEAIRADPGRLAAEQARKREYHQRPDVKEKAKARAKAWALANPDRALERATRVPLR